jgi:hypothetical protein
LVGVFSGVGERDASAHWIRAVCDGNHGRLRTLGALPNRRSSEDPECSGQWQDRSAFFYNSGEAYTFPLIFHVAPPDDPRLNTMPFLREGWIAYITQPEMRLLLKGLSGLDLKWKETPKMIPLGPGFPGPLTNAAVITVLSPRGTARGEVHPPIRNYDPSAICDKLLPLQSSVTRTRARWEFEWVLSRWGCKVHGFDRDAFSFKGQKSVW